MNIQALKDIAANLGISYHHKLGSEKLEELIREHCTTLDKTLEEIAEELDISLEEPVEDIEVGKQTGKALTVEALSKLTFAEVDQNNAKKNANKVHREAMRLVRCIITCNNKNKTSYQGEIFCARNARIPEVKKFIPFGVPTHIPTILLNMIKEKQYQMFRKKKLPNGNVITESYLVPEYNIQELDPITPAEYEAIRQKQLAEGKGND